ncbi:MAG: right-handed parallel beta-helix repeat-containing protein [Clostridia bacterium]|nr:right-handed parallel beta-helix repeat-containing protein [Clostridia bacterium]
MKKIVTLILIVLSLLQICPICADEAVSVFLDNEQIQFDVEPIVVNDRTMVPMRAIFEKLGAEVTWDESTNTAIAYDYSKMYGVSITIGIPHMLDTFLTPIPLDVPAMLHNNRTLVPLRAISEAFECRVEWDDATSTVNIYSKSFIDFSKETEQTTVKVGTVDELLSNIGSNKHIILTSDYYNISDARKPDNPYIEKSEYSEGYVIKNVINMTIEGKAEIAINDIYADVLSFENCGKITLDGLTVGHTEPNEEYLCDGCVTSFSNCKLINIVNCNLYGCGAIGVSAYNVDELIIDHCDIYDCSYAGVLFQLSSNVKVSDTEFYDGIYFCGVCLISDSDVDFTNCIVRDNKLSENGRRQGLIVTSDSFFTKSKINWNNSKFINNSFHEITNDETSKITFTDCIFQNNTGNLEHPSVIYSN